MSAVTITAATRDIVTWRVGNSLHIESSRDAVAAWIGEADFMGHVDVDGLILTPGDLANMAAAMDDAGHVLTEQEAFDVAAEKRAERAADFDSNWS